MWIYSLVKINPIVAPPPFWAADYQNNTNTDQESYFSFSEVILQKIFISPLFNRKYLSLAKKFMKCKQPDYQQHRKL